MCLHLTVLALIMENKNPHKQAISCCLSGRSQKGKKNNEIKLFGYLLLDIFGFRGFSLLGCFSII